MKISNFDKIYDHGYRFQQKNKFLDIDPIDNDTLRVFDEKPTIINKVINLHEEMPAGMLENKKTKVQNTVAEVDIPFMWRRLNKEHPDAFEQCQWFDYDPMMQPTRRKRKIFPSDSELELERKLMPKVTAFIRTNMAKDQKLQPEMM